MSDYDSGGYGPEARRREGLSTGAKIGIGCGVAVLVVLVAGAIFVGWVVNEVQKQAGGEGAHEAATETLARLAEDYPFTPPADGVVTADQAWTFITVTDDVWSQAEPWIEEANRALERFEADGERPSMRTLLTGFRGMARLMRVRLLLAESLEHYRMSSDEYAWVGATLVAAYQKLRDPNAAAVPAANLELARDYESQLADIARSDRVIWKDWVLIMAGGAVERSDIWKIFGREIPGR